MIKDIRAWEAWERESLEKENLIVEEKFRMLNAMYDYARVLGVLPPEYSMEGIEADIRIARIINGVSENSLKNSSRF